MDGIELPMGFWKPHRDPDALTCEDESEGSVGAGLQSKEALKSCSGTSSITWVLIKNAHSQAHP